MADERLFESSLILSGISAAALTGIAAIPSLQLPQYALLVISISTFSFLATSLSLLLASDGATRPRISDIRLGEAWRLATVLTVPQWFVLVGICGLVGYYYALCTIIIRSSGQ